MSKEWRCFHCDEIFTDAALAAEHFGSDEGENPACKLNALEGGLLKLYRKAQADLLTYRTETDQASKTFYALGADHQVALIKEEQRGYDKGLADGRAERDRLETALRDLAKAELEYRRLHDLNGGGDMKTGRAWDKMSYAGDSARALIGEK